MKSLMERLYTSAGNLRKTAYMYKGDVVNPKDTMKDGVMALDMGRKHGIKKLEGILSMALELKEPTTIYKEVINQDGQSYSKKFVTKEAYSFSYKKPSGLARVKRNALV